MSGGVSGAQLMGNREGRGERKTTGLSLMCRNEMLIETPLF